MFSHEKRYTHCPEKESLHMRSESGTCNVCAAPCSSCMHYNRAVPAMESTVEDCFSEDIGRGNEATQCISSNVPINRSRKCDDWQHVTSESSNIISASSSHDSVSENAESKASMKNCGTYDASENVVMPLNLSGETVKGDQHRFVQSDFTSPQNQGVSGAWNASSSDVYEDQRVLECHGDNISCIRGDRVRGVTAASSSLMEDLDRKNIFPSVCSKESLEKKGSSLSSATVGFSHQSHILESPVLKDVHTIGQESAAHGSSSILGRVGNSNTICLRANCSSENQVDMVNEKHPDKDTGCVVENRQSEMTNSLSDSDLQDSKVEMDHESNHSDSENLLDNELIEGEVLKNELIEGEVLKVKVCDICGDAGREDLLAFCSRCTDGAEHT
ncbi:hypothetical protein QJS10_CPB20g01268 [Acorus calamus]|uniref:Uncharacterized protein n=1 Tax=Acorus calamus TaxID=4465 RepID=A0AAV9CB71_ACOCL|nr:hypothetical protein QJS10_CPB20g01268 [Acorus calamus]